MWTRAAAQYPTSLALLTVMSVVITTLDFVQVAIVFHNTSRLVGFPLADVAFLYGTSAMSLAVADLLLGNLERVGLRVRDGTFDSMLLRPASPLIQLATDQFAVRRVGRLLQALTVLCVAVAVLPIHWTLDRALLVPGMVMAGAAIFGAIFVIGGAFQIFANDAAEVMNAFTYGGQQMTQYPLAVYTRELLRLVTFIVPLGFINWYPALRVLSRPDPLHLPRLMQFASPAVALVFGVVAAGAWRISLRHYTSTGS